MQYTYTGFQGQGQTKREVLTTLGEAKGVLIICFTTCTAHFCGYKVVRLQNSSYLCSSYNRKTIIMVYSNFSLVGDNVLYCASWIVYLCNHATAQLHIHITARFGGRAVTYPRGRAVGQSCSYVNNIQCTDKNAQLRGCTTAGMHIFHNVRINNHTTAQPQRCKVAEKRNRVVARSRSQVITQPHNRVVLRPHNRTFAETIHYYKNIKLQQHE